MYNKSHDKCQLIFISEFMLFEHKTAIDRINSDAWIQHQCGPIWIILVCSVQTSGNIGLIDDFYVE